MFDGTLNSSWNERSRRGLSALTSFALQGLVAGTLLLFSLFRPAGLPSFHSLSTPVSLGQPLGEPPAVGTHARENSAAAPNNPAITLRMPTRIPNEIPDMGDDTVPTVGGFGGPNSGSAPIGDLRGVPNLLGDARPVLPAAVPTAKIAPLRISHISEGNLIRKILPTYPALARSARIQGQVALQAVISKQGVIENLQVVSGHPMLVPAAIEAVRQWRYRPYILNNEPVEVETQITVNFSLGGN
jgi:periplasmic protein TonB